jgi:hypothetical protein
MDLTMMERVGDRLEKMEGSCSTGQSPQWAVVPVEKEGGGGGGGGEEEEEVYKACKTKWIYSPESSARWLLSFG